MKFQRVFSWIFLASAIFSVAGLVQAADDCSNKLCVKGTALDGYPFGQMLVVTDPKGPYVGLVLHSKVSDIVDAERAALLGNFPDALKLWETAARSGDHFAAQNAGVILYNGAAGETDLAKAVMYFSQARQNASIWNTTYSFIVKVVQRRLYEAGYYSGREDGDLGEGTWSAIRSYEAAHGRTLGSNPDKGPDGTLGRKMELLLQIGLGEENKEVEAPAPLAENDRHTSRTIALADLSPDDSVAVNGASSSLVWLVLGVLLALALVVKFFISRSGASEISISDQDNYQRGQAQHEELLNEQSKREQRRSVSDGEAKKWYEVLNVPSDASMEEISKSYKSLMGKYHPDKVASLGDELKAVAEKISKIITEAYRDAKRERGVS